MSTAYRLTQAELDQLIAEVEQDVVNGHALLKSEDAKEKAEKMSKDDRLPEEDKEESMPPHEDSPPAEETPEEESPSEEAPAEEMPSEMPEEESAPADDELDLPPENQDPDQDGPDLQEIYGSMDEDQLEAHYEAIKCALHDCWEQQASQDWPEQEMGSPEPEELDDCEMGKAEVKTSAEANGGQIKSGKMSKEEEKSSDEDEEEDKKDKKADEKEDKKDKKEEDKVEKSQKDLNKEIEALKKSNETLEESLARFVEAAERRLPSRKSAIEFIPAAPVEQKLEGASLKEAALEVTAKALTKSERQTLNRYFIDGQGEVEVQELIKRKKT